MARQFRRQRASHPIADLNVTNLIDLGFMLLIIFMVATPLIQQEQTIPLKLPHESKSAQPKAPKENKVHAVSIDASGRFYLDSDPTPMPMAALKSRLTAFAAGREKPLIRIRGDEGVPFGKVVQVMDELKKLDLTSVTIDTQTAP